MANPSKRKGDRGELELARLLEAELGIRVQRKLGAGRKEDTGDLHGLAFPVQAKNYVDITRALREALNGARDQRQNAGAPCAAGAVRLRGGRWAIVMDLEDWCFLYREAIQ